MSARRLMFMALGAFALLAAILIIALNRSLAGLAGDFFPGATPWAHLALIVVEALALLWFWRGLFGRRHYLMVKPDPTPEERLEFARELFRRLGGSRLPWEKLPGDETSDHDAPDSGKAPPGAFSTQSAVSANTAGGCVKTGAGGISEAAAAGDDQTELDSLEKRVRERLTALNARADEEIKSAARRVFLGTALSQNGRLDGLIVFVSLCRLVWRISGIYNQRPHPREIMSLYWTVVSTTFLALSIEELNLTTEITVGFGESLQATAPAAATSSMPFVGAALQTFTASAIDGAANCFLILRAGIITRNAYAYSLDGRRPGRAAVFREAGAMLLGMSGVMMEHLARSLGNCLGGKIAGIGRMAQDATLQAGKSVADATLLAGKSVAGATAYTGKTVADSAVRLADGAAGAVIGTGTLAGKAAGKVVETAGDAVAGVAKGTVVAIKATGKATGKAGRALSSPFRRGR